MLDQVQRTELQAVLDRFKSVLDKEPGLTTLVKFQIDTGKELPIYQRPYGIPVTLREKVDSEIDWLLERGFIRPSSSPWASPMVTVKKADGSARLCLDFRKINGLTRQHAQGGGGARRSRPGKVYQQVGPLEGVLPGPAC